MNLVFIHSRLSQWKWDTQSHLALIPSSLLRASMHASFMMLLFFFFFPKLVCLSADEHMLSLKTGTFLRVWKSLVCGNHSLSLKSSVMLLLCVSNQGRGKFSLLSRYGRESISPQPVGMDRDSIVLMSLGCVFGQTWFQFSILQGTSGVTLSFT